MSTGLREIVLVLGGAPTAMPFRPPAAAVVIAADSGIDVARSWGWPVHHGIGDFDSVTDDGLAWATDSGATIHRHPVDKDATDLELALDLAASMAPASVDVVGGVGGRPDHALANLLALATPKVAAMALTHHSDTGTTSVVHAPGTFLVAPQRLFSVIPVHGPAEVSVGGARWPLERSVLEPGTTRGLSNRTVTEGLVTVHDGTVFIVLPTTDPPTPTSEVSP